MFAGSPSRYWQVWTRWKPRARNSIQVPMWWQGPAHRLPGWTLAGRWNEEHSQNSNSGTQIRDVSGSAGVVTTRPNACPEDINFGSCAKGGRGKKVSKQACERSMTGNQHINLEWKAGLRNTKQNTKMGWVEHRYERPRKPQPLQASFPHPGNHKCLGSVTTQKTRAWLRKFVYNSPFSPDFSFRIQINMVNWPNIFETDKERRTLSILQCLLYSGTWYQSFHLIPTSPWSVFSPS